jgi:uncharacterized protein (DUF1697 family)
MPSSHIALLRGINVTGKHVLPMKDLKAIFEASGARDVSTYIQSGNVLFNASPKAAAAIAARVHARIEADFGFTSPVIVRKAQDLGALPARNPFLPRVTDFSRLLVFFLEHPSLVTSLDLLRFAPDEFTLSSPELFAYFPRGVGQSKFNNTHLEKIAGSPATGRNWNTVLKLIELAK